MARKQKSPLWLIFVDTNVLLDFYRLGGESADRQLRALERHKGLIITSDQIRMEFLKNRQKVIIESVNKIKKPDRLTVPPIITNYQATKTTTRDLNRAANGYARIQAKIEKVLREPIHHDPVYQSLNRIFNHASPFNLRRPDDARYTIRNLARKRFVLGYPPRKNGDTSIGDATNWEWIVKCAQLSTENHHVLIVSRDGDYGSSYRGDPILNDWLREEFKSRVSRHRKIELTNKLTVALRRLDEAVTLEDETEEKKILSSPPQVDWRAHFADRKRDWNTENMRIYLQRFIEQLPKDPDDEED